MSDECFKCGASGDNVKLSRAISDHGIVSVCDYCAAVEKMPRIKKATDQQIQESQRQKSVRDRLTQMNKKFDGSEVNLRSLVDKKFKERGVQHHPELVENFHWAIQKVKRMRKITREEFAKGIGESDATVRMLEQGFVPNNDYRIISKVEAFLRVNLHKLGAPGFPAEPVDPMKKYSFDSSMVKDSEKKLAFDADSTKILSIEDLREMDKKVSKEQKGLFSFLAKKKQEEKKTNEESVDGWEEEYSQDDEKFLDENFEKEEKK
jgi:ribosome-binding protein aMBF1 (putative translation factor)